MGTIVFTQFDVYGEKVGSKADDAYNTLGLAGYTGSMADRERQDFLVKLSLSEPPAVLKSHADLEYAYLGSIGKTGTLSDRKHN